MRFSVSFVLEVFLYNNLQRSLLEGDDVEDKEITKVVLLTPILLLSPE